MLPVRMISPQAKNLVIITEKEKHSSQLSPDRNIMIRQITKRDVIVEATVIRFINP
jgi:hypothetical protein